MDVGKESEGIEARCKGRNICRYKTYVLQHFLYRQGINRSSTIMKYGVGCVRSFAVVYWYNLFACLPCSFKKSPFEVVLSKIPNQDGYLSLASPLQRFAFFKPLTNF